MKVKIWKEFAQILYNRPDLLKILKPFFDNLNNNNINDTQNISDLKSFSKDQLKVLYQKEIITKKTIDNVITYLENHNNLNEKSTILEERVERILSGDQIVEFQELLNEIDFNMISTVTKSFREVEKMKIPLIEYCIMKKAINCFKFLLINGKDDPNKAMEEQNPSRFFDEISNQEKEIKRYKWDCMAHAIYIVDNEIMRILEEKGITIGKNPAHIEAAILSYRNGISKDMIEEMQRNNKNESYLINIILTQGLITSGKNNNIKGGEILITKGADINSKDINYQNIKILFLINGI